ncbi:kinase-like domain-containing protein [Aspergillus pseudoustus]|uniref:Kinase-like domain-containing protein n=1 Tax=Aspergillus pseudoustus TaxID=1810923 RepID=A0ABR4K495_9EURO
MDARIELREILAKMRRTSIHKNHYYPEALLRGRVNTQLIRKILEGIFTFLPEERNFYASLIYDNALLVFCILFVRDREHLIREFLHNRLYDTKLCLERSQLGFLATSDYLVCDDFITDQWAFKPFYFSKGMIHASITRQTILPYSQDESTAGGAFGSVYTVQLDSYCHNLEFKDYKGTQLIARKEVKAAPKELTAVNNERAVLEMLRNIRHPNIIELLSSYRCEETHNFLFPLAEDNLADWLKTKPDIEPDEMYYQLYGLTEGLKHIHQYRLLEGDSIWRRIGYHHDLRPANILRMGERLVIADFGLSALKPTSGTSKDLLHGGQEDYLSPEARHEDFTRGEVGRAHDIWALGCIFAEILTVMEGCSLDNFQECRRTVNSTETDHRFHQHGSVKASVEGWLDMLSGGPGYDRAVKSSEVPAFVGLIKSMLSSSRYERPGIEFIVKEMATISFRVKMARLGLEMEKYTIAADLAAGTQMFMLLEAQRFEAIQEAYEACLRSYLVSFHHGASIILATMVRLQKALHTHDCVEQEEIETVYQLLDQIMGYLPLHLIEQAENSWSASVSGIEDLGILAKFECISVIPPRYHNIGSTAVMRHIAIALSNAIRRGQAMSLADASLITWSRGDDTHSQNLDEFGKLRTTAIYSHEDGRPRNVLIEWRKYHVNSANSPMEQKVDQMAALARLLHSASWPNTDPYSRLVQLDCLCFYHDAPNRRFGFVYDFPPEKRYPHCKFPKIYSLQQYIDDTSPPYRKDSPRYARPYLGAVFQLARDLAGTLYGLHKTGWLHKSISSYNVLMFCEPEYASKCFNSCVLAGFAQTRREDTGHSDRGLFSGRSFYDHPEYEMLVQSNQWNSAVIFKKPYDYYSLGVVLLELGLWRNASKLLKASAAAKEPPAKKARAVGLGYGDRYECRYMQMFLDVMPDLGARMGESYMEAVKFCLTAEFSEVDTLGDPEQCARGFKKNVIDRLAECRA